MFYNESEHGAIASTNVNQNSGFSACGQFFNGRLLSSYPLLRRFSGSKMDSLNQHGNQRAIIRNSKGMRSDAFTTSLWCASSLSGRRPAVQNAGTLIGAVDASGMRAISNIEQTSNGAVVLQALREDGLMTSTTLTRVPSWATDAPATLLVPQENHPDHQQDSVRLMLNQRAYNFKEYQIPIPPSFRIPSSTLMSQLPVLVERKRETMPMFYGTGIYAEDGKMRFTGDVRKRLGEYEEHFPKRVRR